jgi:hypothetical protein
MCTTGLVQAPISFSVWHTSSLFIFFTVEQLGELVGTLVGVVVGVKEGPGEGIPVEGEWEGDGV